MSVLKILRHNERGAAAIEMAIALPVLLVMIYGIFQVGLVFQANAGMQHALGEGARYATIFPAPTNAQIKQRMDDSAFGVGIGTFNAALPVDGTNYKDLSVTFSMPTFFLFFEGPDVSLTRTKRVYIAAT